jgi:hypothetical protein
MSGTPETFQSAWISSLKSKTAITSLLANAREIREIEWQGTDFDYPAVRVGLDFMPSIERCGPDDAEIIIEVFSDEKSSKKASHIASLIYTTYHGKAFTSGGVRFSTVIVREIERPDRSIYAWQRNIKIFCQGI